MYHLGCLRFIVVAKKIRSWLKHKIPFKKSHGNESERLDEFEDMGHRGKWSEMAFRRILVSRCVDGSIHITSTSVYRLNQFIPTDENREKSDIQG